MIGILSIFYKLPRLTTLAIMVVLIGGLGALFTLGRQEDPTLIERYGFVLTVMPGADAERMEALVTEPLETALMELPELEEIYSTTRAGVSQVGLQIGQRTPGAAQALPSFLSAQVVLQELEGEGVDQFQAMQMASPLQEFFRRISPAQQAFP